MKVQPIYLWDGRYFGFIQDGYFFDREGHYLGWVEKHTEVYRPDGMFFGELVDDSYILKRYDDRQRMPKIPKLAPPKPNVPPPRMDRIGRTSREGWYDVLAQYRPARAR